MSCSGRHTRQRPAHHWLHHAGLSGLHTKRLVARRGTELSNCGSSLATRLGAELGSRLELAMSDTSPSRARARYADTSAPSLDSALSRARGRHKHHAGSRSRTLSRRKRHPDSPLAHCAQCGEPGLSRRAGAGGTGRAVTTGSVSARAHNSAGGRRARCTTAAAGALPHWRSARQYFESKAAEKNWP
jgi:hypothetical protein